MKNLKTKSSFLVATLLVASFILLGTGIQTAKAVTLDELQIQIDALMAQITNLQQQKVQLQAGSASQQQTDQAWCHTFNVRLKYGDTGSEVQALKTALLKQGFVVPPDALFSTTRFDEKMASAVVGFQEKYRADILSPYNISHGTGYVGPTTLAKLNELYGCKVIEKVNISITPTNVIQGQTYTFYGKVLQASPNSAVKFYLKSSTGNMLENGKYIGITNPNGFLSMNQSQEIYSIAPTGIYTAWVTVNGYISNVVSFTVSEYYSAHRGCHTSTPWSWNYCSASCPCSAGEGDCDSDNDCTTGYCAKDVGANYGQDSTKDVCEVKSTTSCTDSDGGKDYFVKGTVVDEGKSYTDYCQGAFYLKEYFCLPKTSSSLGGVAEEDVVCPNSGSCVDGACTSGINVTKPINNEQLQAGTTYTIKWNSYKWNSSVGVDVFLLKGENTYGAVAKNISIAQGYYHWQIPSSSAPRDDYRLRFFYGDTNLGTSDYFTITEASTSCTDTDGGKDYFVKGTTTGLSGNNIISTNTDYCSGDNLVEWFCSGKYRTNTNYTCPLGCSDGACIQATGLSDMEKQLASASDAIAQIIENLKKLMGK